VWVGVSEPMTCRGVTYSTVNNKGQLFQFTSLTGSLSYISQDGSIGCLSVIDLKMHLYLENILLENLRRTQMDKNRLNTLTCINSLVYLWFRSKKNKDIHICWCGRAVCEFVCQDRRKLRFYERIRFRNFSKMPDTQYICISLFISLSLSFSFSLHSLFLSLSLSLSLSIFLSITPLLSLSRIKSISIFSSFHFLFFWFRPWHDFAESKLQSLYTAKCKYNLEKPFTRGWFAYSKGNHQCSAVISAVYYLLCQQVAFKVNYLSADILAIATQGLETAKYRGSHILP
jgi:hypothetical protein